MGREMTDYEQFKAACERVFMTEDGAIVLDCLKRDYLESSSVRNSSELTYYALGQKELVQLLVRLADTNEKLIFNDTILEGE